MLDYKNEVQSYKQVLQRSLQMRIPFCPSVVFFKDSRPCFLAVIDHKMPPPFTLNNALNMAMALIPMVDAEEVILVLDTYVDGKQDALQVVYMSTFDAFCRFYPYLSVSDGNVHWVELHYPNGDTMEMTGDISDADAIGHRAVPLAHRWFRSSKPQFSLAEYATYVRSHGVSFITWDDLMDERW